MHPNAKLLFQKYALPYFASADNVLEIGPDGESSGLRQMAGRPELPWTGLDLVARPGVQVVARSEYDFPVNDGAFAVVLSANVIEHVRKPWRWMRELARVCRPGGHIITINPVSWEYHEYPIDCWRIYPEGMKALSEDCGLEVVLSTFECLEIEPRHWRIPGHSTGGLKVTLGKLLHLPIQCAFDTVTIARKPA